MSDPKVITTIRFFDGGDVAVREVVTELKAAGFDVDTLPKIGASTLMLGDYTLTGAATIRGFANLLLAAVKQKTEALAGGDQ